MCQSFSSRRAVDKDVALLKRFLPRITGTRLRRPESRTLKRRILSFFFRLLKFSLPAKPYWLSVVGPE